MSNKDLDQLEPYCGPGDTVYLLRRDVISSRGRAIVSGILDFFFQTRGLAATVDAVENRWYLVASAASGKLIRLERGRLAQTVDVAEWDPSYQNQFTKLVQDGARYVRVQKVR